MIHEPQEAPLTFLIDPHGTDSMANRRSDDRVQYSIGVLQRYLLKSLVDLTQVLPSRV